MEVDLVDDLEMLEEFDELDYIVSGVTHPDEQFGPDKHKYDTTSAEEYRNGRDMQAIPWERLEYTRDDYRDMRLKGYKNYESLSWSHDLLDSECKQVEKKSTFYDFYFNTRLAKSTVVHFQLRDLVWATSKHDVYTAQHSSLRHWSSLHERGKEVINVYPKKHVHGARPPFRMQICTMVVRDNLLVAGGYRGEVLFKYIDRRRVWYYPKVPGNDENITNSVDVYETPNGSTRVMVAKNDGIVRIYDTERFRLFSQFRMRWPVNDTSVSPDGKLVALVGDNADCGIADLQSRKEIATLKGHLDYSFSSAWHPDGRVLATGNQDTTCRLWDVRNLSRSFAVLKGRMGAIRNLKFSSDGRFLAASEDADFVHVYDTHADYSKEQEIDIFGDIAGMSFSPDAEALFVGVSDRMIGSLIEFRRSHRYDYLESYL